MPPDATETKRRLLQAAVDEFARYGLAGARVDRIAEAARANKRSIYMHFGTKEELFDKVVADAMLELAESITFAGDLPHYAGELFDRVRAWPHIRRLYLWAVLERDQPVEPEVEQYRTRVAAIADAQRAGRIRPDIAPAHLMAMVIALVMSWDNAAWSLRAVQPDHSSGSTGDQRSAVVAAVTRLAQP